MSADYKPIACAAHDQIELAIMRRAAVLLAWRDGNHGMRTATVTLKDVQTRDGEEYLRFNDGDISREIRLDQIEAMNGVAVK